MGLDQFLRAKTTKREYKTPTGACNGMFPITPDDNGWVEIGYWRKAYDQDELISNTISAPYEYGSCIHSLITKEEVITILESAKEILETHTFDEEGYDISECYSGDDTWCSKDKWEDTIKYFSDALKILDEDPDAEIYYCSWA